MNHEAVCRSAPATPGLIKRLDRPAGPIVAASGQRGCTVHTVVFGVAKGQPTCGVVQRPSLHPELSEGQVFVCAALFPIKIQKLYKNWELYNLALPSRMWAGLNRKRLSIGLQGRL